MKNILFVFLILCSFIYADDLKTIGVVSYIEGDLTHEYDLSSQKMTAALKKGDMIYNNSMITNLNSKNPVIELVTIKGIFTIGKFPVKNFADFEQLSKTEIMEIKSVIAADLFMQERDTVKIKLSDKYSGKKIVRSDIFKWDTKINAITENQIKNEGLKLLLSRNNSSLSLKNYSPLIFQINTKFKFNSIDYEIYDNAEKLADSGTLKKENENFVFNFDCFNYNYSSYYHVILIFNLANNKIAAYDFYYKIKSPEEMIQIEEEIAKEAINKNTDFLKDITKIFYYDKYALHIKKYSMMIKLGLRPE